MSEIEYDEDGNVVTEGPKALREALKKTAKQNKELLERLALLEASVHGSTIQDAFATRGLDPRIAKFYPGGRATTAESVDEWVDENKEFFGTSVVRDGTPALSSLTPEEQEGYAIMRKLNAAESATQMDFESRLQNASTAEEVLQMMKEFGSQHQF